MKPPKPVYSYLAAVALALVTFFTFYVFRDFGPQSVLRKFHIDVLRRDWPDIQNIAVGSKGDIEQAIGFVTGLAQRNASYEVVRMKRQGDFMLVVVEYRFANGLSHGVVWYVRQTQRDWRVDCTATVRQSYQGQEPFRQNPR
jgi:hypothetical protein